MFRELFANLLNMEEFVVLMLLAGICIVVFFLLTSSDEVEEETHVTTKIIMCQLHTWESSEKGLECKVCNYIIK